MQSKTNQENQKGLTIEQQQQLIQDNLMMKEQLNLQNEVYYRISQMSILESISQTLKENQGILLKILELLKK